MADDGVSWFAAVDWGSEQHQACVLDAAGAIAGERAFSGSVRGDGGLSGPGRGGDLRWPSARAV
jgi:hypothetical protein